MKVYSLEIMNLSGVPRVFPGLCEFAPTHVRVCVSYVYR